MSRFSHLHVHSKYSILDGASDIGKMFAKAIADNMPAVAITDHGNMFGAFKFVAEAERINKAHKSTVVKPIIGCEFYLVENRFQKQFTREIKDKRYHQLLLAKNAQGYNNLIKLSSLGFIEGLYGKYPRIDKELILKYHEGLIATTCCLGAEVPRTILEKGEQAAEDVFKWWLNVFNDDYYIELQRHNIPDQEFVNNVLLKFAAKYNVKTIATNDSHYVDKEFYDAHDILLCVNTGAKRNTPVLKDYNNEDTNVKGKRFAFDNDQFYFKTTTEMLALFPDVPEAIDNTNEIVDKVELLNLKRDILLPHFEIPTGFDNQYTYLRHLTYEGAKHRYGELNSVIIDRIEYELNTINKMNFNGYFLIVIDFIKAGKKMGVVVGSGRGSAAGSLVAYCTGITNIDPLRYNLLFERFLNPERVGMPDIDTDFDDEGRQKVIDYVINKYGKNQVAQIITFNTMAARSSIKDVARVLDLPLGDSSALAKLVPEKAGVELNEVLYLNLEDNGEQKGLIEKYSLSSDDVSDITKIRQVHKENSLLGEVLREAERLEGSVRTTGIHAAGIIIAPKDITEIIPVCTSKETNLLITQYEGVEIESAGVIKMDFLGLKTLSIVRDTLALIKKNHAIQIDIDDIPLDDLKTFELYKKGETNGTFQFESIGMQKNMRELKPDRFEDLIALNALYRPGPMKYIKNYIARKHGREKVEFDLPEMEEYLSETFGITIYQEQLMLLAQKLADFSKADADYLRKAMGKKDEKLIQSFKEKFIEGGKAKKLNEDVLMKIWKDWLEFAKYAFNKSHSTCYATLAYQTAYLKAHYTAEFLAAVLTHNLNDQKKIAFYIDEAKRMNVKVLNPDINESDYNFSVTKSGIIRFGLGAVKGVGESAVAAIIDERNKNGNFIDIFELTKRINLRSVNKRCLESLAMAGAFDAFPNSHRSQYFFKDDNDNLTFLEKIIRHASEHQLQKQSIQTSLFGEESGVEMPEINLPYCEEWSNYIKLANEREVTGFYMSGHPLDDFKIEIKSFCNFSIADIQESNLDAMVGKNINIAGIITSVEHRTSKDNNLFGKFVVEDMDNSIEFVLFSETYMRLKHLLEEGLLVFISASITKNRYTERIKISVDDMGLLRDVLKNKTRNITLTLNVFNTDNELITYLKESVNSCLGTTPLSIYLVDNENNYKFAMRSKYKVDSNAFINEIKTNSFIGIKLN